MYQVNFLPWRIQVQRRRGAFWLRVFALQWVLMLVVLTVIMGLLRQQQAQRHEALLVLVRQQAELTDRHQRLQQAMARLSRLTALAEQYDKNLAYNRRYLRLLQQFSTLLPSSMWLIAFESNAQSISLRGLSRRYEAVVQFEQQLATVPLLQSYRLAEVARRQDGLFSFALVAQWSRRDD